MLERIDDFYSSWKAEKSNCVLELWSKELKLALQAKPEFSAN